MADKHEKTQSATPKRRKEAREKGQVAKSSDLSPAVLLLVTVFSFSLLANFLYQNITEMMKEFYTSINTITINANNLSAFFLSVTYKFMVIMLPIFALTVVIALIANYAQVGFLLTGKPVKPDWGKISPAKGFKRIFSMKAFVELLKSLFKITVIGYLVYSILINSYPVLISTADMEIINIFQTIGSLAYELGIKSAFVLLTMALIDYVYQRHDFEKSIKMSVKEVKDELKQQEGDPLIKARIKQRQRQLAMQRMMQDVPAADVIITNPTHLAVALKYDRKKMGAPKVLAKGERLIAQKIKKIAEENSVPVIEDKPLAQALFRSVKIGFEIPGELFQAVAEILALVYKLNRRIQERTSHGSF